MFIYTFQDDEGHIPAFCETKIRDARIFAKSLLTLSSYESVKEILIYRADTKSKRYEVVEFVSR